MSFPQAVLFQEHIYARHSELVIQGNLEAIISRCERTIITHTVCPLCGVKFALQTLEKHLGLHLQEVALFALPHPDKGSSESKSMKVGHSRGNSGEHSSRRSTLKVESDSKQPGRNPPLISPPAIEGIRCICSYQHDDGFLITCDRCKEFQHGVCMGIDRNNVPEVYECSACIPGAYHLDIEGAIHVQEGFLKSYQSQLQKAIQEYVNQLSDDDKAAFLCAPNIMELIQNSQSGREFHISLTTRVEEVLQCVRAFMSCLGILIPLSPEISSLAVGGINCILAVSTSSTYFLFM